MIKQVDLKIRIVVILALVALNFFYIVPLKDKLKLGLDLKGGMYLVLKADVAKIPREGVSRGELFSEEQIAKLKDNKLIAINEKKNEIIWFATTEENLATKLRAAKISNIENVLNIWRQSSKTNVNEAIKVAVEVIRNRIDEFGVKEPIIQVQGGDSLLVQLPGEVNRNRAVKLIGQ